MAASLEEALQGIVGEKLSSVAFVMDYWQLDFDGHQLTVLTQLSVGLDGSATRNGEPRFRDLLCEQIGKRFERAQFEADLLLLGFSDKSSVAVFARPSDYTGPEALTFRSGRFGTLYVV